MYNRLEQPRKQNKKRLPACLACRSHPTRSKQNTAFCEKKKLHTKKKHTHTYIHSRERKRYPPRPGSRTRRCRDQETPVAWPDAYTRTAKRVEHEDNTRQINKREKTNNNKRGECKKQGETRPTFRPREGQPGKAHSYHTAAATVRMQQLVREGGSSSSRTGSMCTSCRGAGGRGNLAVAVYANLLTKKTCAYTNTLLF